MNLNMFFNKSTKKTYYLIADVESTGCDLNHDLIFDLAFLLTDGTEVIEVFQKYINIDAKEVARAQQEIGSFVHIDAQKIKEALPGKIIFQEALDFIAEIYKKYTISTLLLVAHNIAFDYFMILNNMNKLCYKMGDAFKAYFANHKVDSVVLCRKLYPGLARFSLNYVVKHLCGEAGQKLLNDRNLNKHSALLDCHILFVLLKKIRSDYPFIVFS